MQSVHAATSASAAQPPIALAQACSALWTATLALMSAFMLTQAPAHRHLMARRIAHNLATLHQQECFDAGCRAKFLMLSGRWSARAEEYAPSRQPPAGGFGLWKRLFPR